MRPIDPVALTLELVDIPSVTGHEGPLAAHLSELCAGLGLQVHLHEVEPGRSNLLACRGIPSVLLCTHLDTVPPFFDAREDATHVHGRGACDAKGIIACMLAAVQRLCEAGESGFGMLFTVAEEADSLGAKRANAELDLPVRHIVVGEPTDNRLALAQKGLLTARLRAVGRAAHGAYPEAGTSAVRELAGVIRDLYAADWGRSAELGANVLNVGLMQGGVAVNVIAPEATADLQVRIATSAVEVEAQLLGLVAGRAEVMVRHAGEPLRLGRLEGYPTTVVGFGTDLPYLERFGQRYLLGPGSILEAHTVHEKVAKEELLQAVELYVRLVTELLQEPGLPV